MFLSFALPMRYLFVLFIVLVTELFVSRSTYAAYPATRTVRTEFVHADTAEHNPGITSRQAEESVALTDHRFNGLTSLLLGLGGMIAFIAAVGTMAPLYFALGIALGAIAIIFGLAPVEKRQAGMARAGMVLGIIDVVVTVAAALILLL
jgi:hypothetical protein